LFPVFYKLGKPQVFVMCIAKTDGIVHGGNEWDFCSYNFSGDKYEFSAYNRSFANLTYGDTFRYVFDGHLVTCGDGCKFSTDNCGS